MIKQLLSILAVASVVTVSAQTNGRKATIVTFPESVQTSVSAGKTAAAGCSTVSLFTGTNISLYTAGSDTSTPGCSPKAGYVYGSNCYADKEKANYFGANTYSSVTSPSVTGVIVAFYKNTTKGTAGTTSTVGLVIYSGTSNTVAPGSVLGGTMATLAQVISAQPTPTNTLFYYTFNFPTPVVAPGTGFFSSLILPTNSSTGDTAVVGNQTATVNNAWEKGSNNVWADMSVSWGLTGNIAMFPIVCGNVATGISNNSGISKNVTILPNPSTGMVNVIVTLPKSENITLTVTNALGQQVLANKYDAISNESIGLDLTGHANGVYFITVSNGTDKMVQRLILSK